MSPSIIPGDYILVSKSIYGFRILNISKLFKENKIVYHWFQGFTTPKKNEIVVFIFPNYKIDHDVKNNNKYLVKRCVGIPGDTLNLNLVYTEFGENENRTLGFFAKPDLFPHDKNLKWTSTRYGPLWIPGKNLIMSLSSENVAHYFDVLRYEGFMVNTSENTSYIISNQKKYIRFSNNYYFMLGDNTHVSIDSRYWGFVPQDCIVGKVFFVLFSLDPLQPWYKKFRWERTLNIIK